MLTVHSLAPLLQRPNTPFPKISHHSNFFAPVSTVAPPIQMYGRPKTPPFISKASGSEHMNFHSEDGIGGDEDDDDEDELSDLDRFRLRGEIGDDEDEAEEGAFSARSGFGEGKRGDKNYDRDPEFAEILGTVLDDPEKAQKKMEERFKKKRNNILHSKTGSATPMKVLFNKWSLPLLLINIQNIVGIARFDFTNSYIWFEFYNIPLEKDITLISDAIRAWFVIGCLGGCNTMNMQLSESATDSKRPTYDAVEGANVEPTTFYNIGDFEVQYNLARVWVDVGTSEPMILDILINALTQISSDYVGIKQVVFGGSEFENWNENLTTEEAGYSVHKI